MLSENEKVAASRAVVVAISQKSVAYRDAEGDQPGSTSSGGKGIHSDGVNVLKEKMIFPGVKALPKDYVGSNQAVPVDIIGCVALCDWSSGLSTTEMQCSLMRGFG